MHHLHASFARFWLCIRFWFLDWNWLWIGFLDTGFGLVGGLVGGWLACMFFLVLPGWAVGIGIGIEPNSCVIIPLLSLPFECVDVDVDGEGIRAKG